MIALQNLFIFAGCAAFPLYFFPSGGLQVAHVLFAFGAFLMLGCPQIRTSVSVFILLALMSLSLFREAVGVASGHDIEVLKQPLYIAFNILTFMAVQNAYYYSRSTTCYKWGLIAASVIALGPLMVTGIQLSGEKVVRSIGTFNNPNQLAYFSVVMFSLTMTLLCFGRISQRLALILVVATVILSLSALSKSGLIGILSGIVLFSFGVASAGVVIYAVIALLAVLFYSRAIEFERLMFWMRLRDIGGDPDDGLAQRGYFVLWEAGENAFEILFGLGKNGITVARGAEVHSTYMAYFGLYGLVGGLLFLAFLFYWVWRLRDALPITQVAAITFPPLLYGIAHNGTRFTIVYVLIALSLSLAEEKESLKAAATPSARRPRAWPQQGRPLRTSRYVRTATRSGQR